MLPQLVKHPEMLLEKGQTQGYEYAILSNRNGYRCGYLKVHRPHPWYQIDCRDLSSIPVHGGLTFSGVDSEDSGWWVGFDCCHSCDLADPDLVQEGWYKEEIEKINQNDILFLGSTIKDVPYVRSECKKLATQAEIYKKRANQDKVN